MSKVEELGWISGCSGGLIVNIGFHLLRSDQEKIQIGEVRNWVRGRKEFRLVEFSR